MPSTYADVQQTPGDGWFWAAVPVTGGKAQVFAIHVEDDLVSTDNPIPCTLITEP